MDMHVPLERRRFAVNPILLHGLSDISCIGLVCNWRWVDYLDVLCECVEEVRGRYTSLAGVVIQCIKNTGTSSFCVS